MIRHHGGRYDGCLSKRGFKNPCGRDGQILADYYPRIRVVVMSPAGPVSILAGELLPLAYDYNSEQH
ncbi:hypothetical protein CQ018_03490 [Arthrobacter sp. MYb227]|uniref:hypothetical protein n=1 Tax=Arthrobacter sp. MYb227 TaxID=1848601 RepID=UPI000CFAB3BA|nr:hypothetical protein [Arthrobacter sp. MYb227]PQZ96341.1 hypothetical protein CQ018_03490 [Arthrobacter sp. MYb227]